MFLGDVGDTDIHKQHDAAMMEKRACLFITSRDKVTMHRSQQLQQFTRVLNNRRTLEPSLTFQHRGQRDKRTRRLNADGPHQSD